MMVSMSVSMEDFMFMCMLLAHDVGGFVLQLTA